MIWLFTSAIVSQALPFFSLAYGAWVRPYWEWTLVGLSLLQVAIYVLLIVGVVLMLTARGHHPLLITLCAIVMVAPCGNVLLLLLVNMSVTRTLRRAGLHVGLAGVKDEEVERLLNPMLCKQCGYNLTGNVSGICSECGRPIERTQL